MKILNSDESEEIIDDKYADVLHSLVTSSQLKGTNKEGDLVEISRSMIEKYVEDPTVEM